MKVGVDLFCVAHGAFIGADGPHLELLASNASSAPTAEGEANVESIFFRILSKESAPV